MGKRIRPRAAMTAALISAVPLVSACGSVKEQQADVVAGKQVFVQKCGACHTLNRAGTKGTTGPNLDMAFRQSLQEGFGRSAVRGVVYEQIQHPARGGVMPAGLVSGRKANDVAAYVAMVASAKGQDTGRLATAVKAAGGGTATEKNGTLTIPADPSGQLAYVDAKAVATAGTVKIVMPNRSGTPHNIAIDGLGHGQIVSSGESSFTAKLQKGKTYTYYCQVPGHRAAGMHGTLTVK